MSITITRAWINQPSKLQPLHHLHGTNVLALPKDGQSQRVYFLSGPVISMEVLGLCLSDGWVQQGESS